MRDQYENVVKLYEEIDGKITIKNRKVIEFWESLGYRKVVVNGGNYILVKIEQGSILKEVKDFNLRDEVRNYTNFIGKIEVYDEYLKKEYIIRKLYEALDTITVEIPSGDSNTGYLFYKNGAVKVEKEEMSLIPYNEYQGYVWEKQINNRDFEIIDNLRIEEIKGSVFYRFLDKIAGESTERRRSLFSIIGYLLHGFKDSANSKAIILMDDKIDFLDSTANGGTGKSLIGKAIGNVIPNLFLNGKAVNFNEKFMLSGLQPYHKIIIIDDVKSNFQFEQLNSLITGDMPIEKKYKNHTVIKFEDSPKILITTNYLVRGSGGNTEKRRKVEFEVSDYFLKITPVEKFGKRFFEDWDEYDWYLFDTLMISLLQYYLKNGLIAPEEINIQINRLYSDTSVQFVTFLDNLLANPNILENRKENNTLIYNKAEIYNLFFKENTSFKHLLTPQKFKKWIDLYCETKKITVFHFKSDGYSLVKFIDVLK